MFLNILKKVKAKKFLRKHLAKQRILETDEIRSISSVACIVNLDEFENTEMLFALAKDLNIQKDQFNIIGCTRTPKKYEGSQIPLLSLKDFNWKLQIKGGNVKTFLDKEYDVLINYFTKEKHSLLYVSTLTRAGIRFGFKRLNHQYNDVIFKVDTNNADLFKSEMLKYLKIMNKI